MYEMDKEIVSIKEEISRCRLDIQKAKENESGDITERDIALESALTRADNIVLLVESMGYQDLQSFIRGPYKREVFKCFRSLGHDEDSANAWTKRHISTPIWVAKEVDAATAAT